MTPATSMSQYCGHHVVGPVGTDVVGRDHEDLGERQRHALAHAVRRGHELVPDHVVGVDGVVGLARDPVPAGLRGRPVDLLAEPGQVALGAHRGDLGLGGRELRLQQEARGLVIGLGLRVDVGPAGWRVGQGRQRAGLHAARPGEVGAATAAASPTAACGERRRGSQRGRRRHRIGVRRRRLGGRVRFGRAQHLVGRLGATGRNIFHHDFLAPRRACADLLKANAVPDPRRPARTLNRATRTTIVLKCDFFRHPDTTGRLAAPRKVAQGLAFSRPSRVRMASRRAASAKSAPAEA